MPANKEQKGKAKPEEKKLTDKQELFCQEYLKDLNATQAAVRAGYGKNTANIVGPRMLVNVSIQKRIQVLMLERSKRTGITVDRVLEEYAKVAFGDIRQAFDGNGDLLPMALLPEDVAACISSIEVDVTKQLGKKVVEVKKVKLWNKLGALDSVGRHLGMFTDKVEHTGKDGAPLIPDKKPDLSKLTKEELRQMAAIDKKLHGS